MKLIPGNLINQDKKGFKWKIEEFDQTRLMLKFEFINPEYISLGDPDTMKITLKKTEAWLKPVD